MGEDEGNNISEIQKNEMNELLEANKSIFNKTGPAAKFAEHHIDTGNNLPVATAPYRLSPIKRAILREELSKMFDENIIEESESPYAPPVVLISKKDGGTRVCIDYRQLNNITVPDRYPLPRIDDLLHEAKSSKYLHVNTRLTIRILAVKSKRK